MVWDTLQSASFMNQSALRAINMNSIIETIYQLAPNYWQEAGDIAIGEGDGELRRLAVPSASDLYLVNDIGVTDLPVWRGLDDVLLLNSDSLGPFLGDDSADDVLSSAGALIGESFAVSSLFVRRPHRDRRIEYRRSATDSWIELDVDEEYEDPMIVIDNSNLDIIRLGLEGSDTITLRCNSTVEITMLVAQSDFSTNVLALNSYFSNNDILGLNASSNVQVVNFEIAATGFDFSLPGFNLVDLTSFYREEFYGDSFRYLFVTLFYRF